MAARAGAADAVAGAAMSVLPRARHLETRQLPPPSVDAGRSARAADAALPLPSVSADLHAGGRRGGAPAALRSGRAPLCPRPVAARRHVRAADGRVGPVARRSAGALAALAAVEWGAGRGQRPLPPRRQYRGPLVG